MPFDSESFTKSLTEKLGPLPGYAWVAIGVGAVYWYRKNHPSTGASISTSPAATVDNSSTPVSSVTGLPTTNSAWGSAAAQSLYGTSAASPTDISTALENYLTGASLTSGQDAIVNQAIASLGNPPEGLIGATVTDPYNQLLSGLTVATPWPNPDITPGYNNPPGFSGPALNDGASGTDLTNPTNPISGTPNISPQGLPTTSSNPSQSSPFYTKDPSAGSPIYGPYPVVSGGKGAVAV